MRLHAFLLGGLALLACACGDDDPGTSGTDGGGGDPTTSSTTASHMATSTSSTGGASTSSTTSSVGGGGTGGSGTGGSGTGGFTPMCVDTPNDTILALKTLDIGDATANGWKLLGFDIDGQTSTSASTDVCKPIVASHKEGAQDGDGGPGRAGLDNSFGSVFVPAIDNLMAGFGASVNSAISQGEFTLMVDLVGLTTDPDQASVKAKIYGGGSLGAAPAFDGTDCWPVTPESLTDTSDITTSNAVFPMAHTTGDLLDSGVIPQLTLTFATSAGTISLTLRKARLQVQLAADHKSATGGQLGGVLDHDAFKHEIERVIAAQISPLFCHVVDGDIDHAADIMNDGTQDNTATCNAVSIGLGFTLGQVKFGGIGPATPPSMVDCP